MKASGAHLFEIRRQQVLQPVLLAGLALVGLWYWSPRVGDAARVAECRDYYAHAHTSADTVRVDHIVPERAGKEPNALTCGNLRRAYPKSFT